MQTDPFNSPILLRPNCIQLINSHCGQHDLEALDAGIYLQCMEGLTYAKVCATQVHLFYSSHPLFLNSER